MTRIVKHYINITSNCNLDCSFCFRDKTEYELNLYEIKKHINKIHKNDYIVLYGGEPTLKPNIIDFVYINTKAKLILVTNGLNIKYLENNYYKFNTVQVSIYNGYEKKQIKFVNNFNCYSHIVLDNNTINNFDFLSYSLENIKYKDKIWMSLDLTMKDTLENRVKIDMFLQFISKYDLITYTHLFLQDVKEYIGRECDHLYNNSMYINTDGNLHNCSHSKYKTFKENRCSNCDNIYCRACVCNIPIINRDIQCYFYNRIKNFIERCNIK